MSAYNVISQVEAAKIIVQSRGAHVAWLGAGVSADAKVLMAQQIADALAQLDWERKSASIEDPTLPELTREYLDFDEFREQAYAWSRRSRRYANVMRNAIPNDAARVKYFRSILRDKRPAFAHYAIALLMEHHILHNICVTTNFDKLLEKAFVVIGNADCQPIRLQDEDRLIEPNDRDLYYCLKLHGDYDTNNILNTTHETRSLPEWAARRLREITHARGLLVLGTAGYEASIRTALNNVANDAREGRSLEQGMLWGIYIEGQQHKDTDKDRALHDADPERYEKLLLERAIDDGAVSPEIVELMEDFKGGKSRFSFFPIWGAGDFLLRLISDPEVDRKVHVAASPHLDSEMRASSLFRRFKLPRPKLVKHIDELRKQQKKLLKATPRTPGGDWVGGLLAFDNGIGVSLCYGDLSDRELLLKDMTPARRAAILSPDDTFLSIGGGAALAIAMASGQAQSIIHDVSKFAPVEVGEVVVTSAGHLPVEHIFHSASLEVQKDGELVGSEDSVSKTVTNALLKCCVLKISHLFVPLLASGRGGIGFDRSASAMLKAITDFTVQGTQLIVVFVVFQEGDMPRTVFEAKAIGVGGRHRNENTANRNF